MSVLGIDPDTHATGFALCRAVSPTQGKVLALGQAYEQSKSQGRHRDTRFFWQARLIHATLSAMFHWAEVEGDPVRKIVVEGQQIYRRGRASPDSILTLGRISAVALFCASFHLDPKQIAFPAPREWKGQQPKQVNWRRTCSYFGWGKKVVEIHNKDHKQVRLVIPSDVALFGGFKRSARKELLDAMGIAKWGITGSIS